MDSVNNLRPPGERTYGLEQVAVRVSVCASWATNVSRGTGILTQAIFSFVLKALLSSKLTIRATPCSSMWVTDMMFLRESRIVLRR
jgi:hypothetical protein